MRNGPACLCMRTSDTRPRESSAPRRSHFRLGRKLARRSTTIARKIKRTCWTLQLHCMLAFGVVVVASIGPPKSTRIKFGAAQEILVAKLNNSASSHFQNSKASFSNDQVDLVEQLARHFFRSLTKEQMEAIMELATQGNSGEGKGRDQEGQQGDTPPGSYHRGF
jgi:hypothetical protein